MVKKVIGLVATFIVAVALILVGIFFDQWILKTHDDVFETEYSYNETHHWKACILPDCKSGNINTFACPATIEPGAFFSPTDATRAASA